VREDKRLLQENQLLERLKQRALSVRLMSRHILQQQQASTTKAWQPA
jgi:hypothetical protein